MRQQICRVVIALACLAGLSGPALAQDNFACQPGSFLSPLEVDNFVYGNTVFGQICVTLTDSTHASIVAETFDDFVMFGAGAFALNVNSTGFVVVGGNGGITGGTNPTATIAFPGGTQDGFGRFDLSISIFDGPNSGTSFFSFAIQNTAGTWANVSSVLFANALGNDAAIQVAECVQNEALDCTGLGFAAEPFTSGHVVPQPAPEPGILGLLGIALLAMGFPALRRRIA